MDLGPSRLCVGSSEYEHILPFLDVSQVRTPALLKIGQSLCGQAIQPPGGDVGLQLAIPRFGVEFRKPCSKRFQFGWAKLANRFFDFVYGSHTNIIHVDTITRKLQSQERTVSSTDNGHFGPKNGHFA